MSILSRHAAVRWLQRLLPWDPRADPMPAALNVENEFINEGLVVFPPKLLVALGEVVPRVHLEALQRFDEPRRVLASPETGFLNADLQEVYALVIRLDKAIGHDPL